MVTKLISFEIDIDKLIFLRIYFFALFIIISAIRRMSFVIKKFEKLINKYARQPS